jgi:hypothetical protein
LNSYSLNRIMELPEEVLYGTLAKKYVRNTYATFLHSNYFDRSNDHL